MSQVSDHREHAPEQSPSIHSEACEAEAGIDRSSSIVTVIVHPKGASVSWLIDALLAVIIVVLVIDVVFAGNLIGAVLGGTILFAMMLLNIIIALVRFIRYRKTLKNLQTSKKIAGND